jgi:hypothetical protein
MKTKAPKRVAKPRKRKPDNPAQFERFIETARKVGVDESGKTFDQAFDRIAQSGRRSPKE